MCRFHQLSVVLVAGLALLVPAARAATTLNVVEVPTNSATVHFTPAKGAPSFGLKADLNYRHGQSRVEVHFSGQREPAILYGGDVTCYVLWAIEPDGSTENLGELMSAGPRNFLSGDRESHHFRTALKRFALLVTAEAYGLVPRPSELVVFTNAPPEKQSVKWEAYTFDGFARAPAHTQESIADLEYKGEEPLALLEARKAFELAGRIDAEDYAPDLYAQAQAELETAEGLQGSRTHRDRFNNAARGAIDASAQAINIATRTMAAELLAEIILERQARMDALEERSEADEMVLATLIERQAVLVSNALSGNLLEVLVTVGDTRVVDEGFVLTLPEVMFQTDVSLLTKEAEIAMAKLAGILLVTPRVGASIGGYTDSTGTLEHNMDLSLRRAQSVATFLADQGVDPGRMMADGFGPEDPVADNSTSEGRSQNRRVEIVLIAGE